MNYGARTYEEIAILAAGARFGRFLIGGSPPRLRGPFHGLPREVAVIADRVASR